MGIDSHIYNFVKESTTTEGTVLNLTLSSVAGFARFSDATEVGDTVYYTILNGLNRELGLGTIQANNVLSRDNPLTTLEAGVYTSPASGRITLTSTSSVGITPSTEVLKRVETDLAAKSFLLVGA